MFVLSHPSAESIKIRRLKKCLLSCDTEITEGDWPVSLFGLGIKAVSYWKKRNCWREKENNEKPFYMSKIGENPNVNC